jgi:hypothetical protein
MGEDETMATFTVVPVQYSCKIKLPPARES